MSEDAGGRSLQACVSSSQQPGSVVVPTSQVSSPWASGIPVVACFGEKAPSVLVLAHLMQGILNWKTHETELEDTWIIKYMKSVAKKDAEQPEATVSCKRSGGGFQKAQEKQRIDSNWFNKVA